MLKALAVAAVAVACVSDVSAQVPQNCVSPREWESRVHAWDQWRKDFVVGHFAYDEHKQRKAIFEMVDFTKKDKTDFFHDIMLFNERKMYHINLRSRECEYRNMPTEMKWRPIGVPPGATFQGQVTIGSDAIDGGSLDINGYTHNFPGFGVWQGSFTNVGCLPVEDMFVSNSTKIPNGFEKHNFFGITLGVSDDNIFIPPAGCVKKN